MGCFCVLGERDEGHESHGRGREGNSWAMHRRSEGNGPLVYPGAAPPHYKEGEGVDGGGEDTVGVRV